MLLRDDLRDLLAQCVGAAKWDESDMLPLF
jgi:hypothetical protein